MIAAGVGSNVVAAGADRFADAQPGRIREVQHEAPTFDLLNVPCIALERPAQLRQF
jgi:hypothetical protein